MGVRPSGKSFGHVGLTSRLRAHLPRARARSNSLPDPRRRRAVVGRRLQQQL
jgi:hypothetical protein